MVGGGGGGGGAGALGCAWRGAPAAAAGGRTWRRGSCRATCAACPSADRLRWSACTACTAAALVSLGTVLSQAPHPGAATVHVPDTVTAGCLEAPNIGDDDD